MSGVVTVVGPLSFAGNQRVVASRSVTFACVGPDGAVLNDGDGGVVGAVTVFTDAAGMFSVDLPSNGAIDQASGVGPPGTYWRATVGVQPAVAWCFRLETADEGSTIVIGDVAHTVVDPGPRSWVPVAGPQGPTGPSGGLAPTTEGALPSAAGVPAGTRIFASDTSTEFEAVGGVWVRRGETKVVHRWARDGATGISWQGITTSTPGTPAWTGRLAGAVAPPHTFSVQNSSRGRFTAAFPDGNLRIAYMLDGTNWQDSEVRSVWYPPSAIDPAKITPQMGHVHRCGPGGAIVVDQNIATYTFVTTWGACWNWSAASPGNIPSIDPAAVLYWQDYATTVDAYMLISSTQAFLKFANNGNFQPGDSVTISNMPVAGLNNTFTLGAFYQGGWFISGSGFTPGAVTVSAGSVTYAPPAANAINPKVGYPMCVASRVTTPPGANPATGSVLALKTWPTTVPEPSWQDVNRVLTLPLIPVAGNTVPTSGQCGIMVNHVHNLLVAGQYVDFSDIECTRL